MSSHQKILCGVPDTDCVGGTAHYGKNFNGPKKAHTSHEEAFRCARRFLIKSGYTQGSDSRSFVPPGGNGPVLVMSKKSRYGGELRKGKGEKGSSSRHMPKIRTNGTIFETPSLSRRTNTQRE